ncbi:DUF7064 domain-containing protein [Candidatus Mycobacterium methanotrophicum]|uniref:DUF7064 domain-containing protein n=1 Tax=Candidatus Mycobacterium methanotrophicum TaxID=2943498 RepID=UPI003F7DBCFC
MKSAAPQSLRLSLPSPNRPGCRVRCSVTASSPRRADGLPSSATLAVDPGDITASIDVRGHAPVRLVSLDGRVSQFPRVWATVSTADGRSGVGSMEWNRNLR